MTTPDPMRRTWASGFHEGSRLRIMDQNEIGVECDVPEVLFCVRHEDIKSFWRKIIGGAVQGIVKCFGNLEEIIAARHYIPMACDADLVEQRDQPVENLGDSSANRGGVHGFN